ncbi:hypothetical protein QRD02_11915 [Aequorivita sp. SDUM287046]|uniref:Uncharacterized protein n=1 Tax=Aequorivita aurantiaca TaxID=3053356 RepID=A0ABT8DPV0_9FLAO|nr:DUF6607 family protein [Aequorivita aurantiaca]MDN3725092.1 hypothetical protein [Aequorivita aurantiaca]
MKKQISFLLALFFSGIVLQAQNKKEMDKQSIKDMCGCYEVTFNFTETFNYSKDSLYKPSHDEISSGLEWAEMITDEDNKIVIQHLLQVGNPAEPMVVKHWRQDWLYENTEFYTYNANDSWQYVTKPAAEVKGQWTQKVYQVDDSPRYEGSGTWVHVDGKNYWENTSEAPLPRREITTRSDYNLTLRRNRVEITDNGWIHDQDNDKIIREAGNEDVLLAKEKGYNTYVKVDDSRCAVAAKWWKDNSQKWALVRDKWDQVYARKKDLSLEEKVDNKHLYKFLFQDEGYSDKASIDGVIDSFVKK